MKDLTIPTRIYLVSIYLGGAALFLWNIPLLQFNDPIMLAALGGLASLALIFKVEGATNRSHYTLSFIVYGFSFAYLGVPETILVIFASNLVQWMVDRLPWFIQVFNAASYIIVIQFTGILFTQINPGMSLTSPMGIFAIVASMAGFTLLNHLLVGIVVWMARGEDFRQSGIFDILPLMIDLSLLCLGAMLVLVWNYNHYAFLLVAFPVFLIYSTIRIPSLERKTVIDQKTGLFNHNYFMQHLKDELNRANRFDRPMTVIMADLDMLRSVNNTYGHLAGDEVLIQVSKILKSSVREYDVVSRFGGEEFTILMPEIMLAQGYERAESIRQTIEKTDFIVPTSVTPIKVTISLGVSSREQMDQTPEDIMHNADAALYHSKLKGRNRTYAYTQDLFVDFIRSPEEAPAPRDEQRAETRKADAKPDEDSEYLAAYSERAAAEAKVTPDSPEAGTRMQTTSTEKRKPKLPVYLYISVLFVLSLLAFGGLFTIAPREYFTLPIDAWLGLGGCVLLVVLTEQYSIDLFTRKTSLSTSAVPILAGTLFFGPIGSLVLSLTYAISTAIKYRSQFNRLVFNFSNQLIAGMLYTALIYMTGKPYPELSTAMQLLFAVLAAVIVFTVNTSLISIGVHLDSGEPLYGFWKENYSWLLPIYIGMGIVAAAFVFGYKNDPLMGSLLVIVPLLLLRISQVQYVDRARTMVGEMREKSTMLEKYAREIALLNEGLLETVSDIIDLRDPHVFGHSRKVTELAVELARRLGLHEKQIELVRKGGMLHDIGKLGISQYILAKSGPLSPDELASIRNHPIVGASLLEKSPNLRPLIPIVHQHHEFYNGEGYPDRISGNQIAIEARIISVADAIEAMSVDRPYRKARTMEGIIEELRDCSGTQFDPHIVRVATDILMEKLEGVATPEKGNQQNAEAQKAQTQLRPLDSTS